MFPIGTEETQAKTRKMSIDTSQNNYHWFSNCGVINGYPCKTIFILKLGIVRNVNATPVKGGISGSIPGYLTFFMSKEI
jgi:hypothetical protein